MVCNSGRNRGVGPTPRLPLTTSALNRKGWNRPATASNDGSSAEADVRVVTVSACGCQQSGDRHIRQEPAQELPLASEVEMPQKPPFARTILSSTNLKLAPQKDSHALIVLRDASERASLWRDATALRAPSRSDRAGKKPTKPKGEPFL